MLPDTEGQLIGRGVVTHGLDISGLGPHAFPKFQAATNELKNRGVAFYVASVVRTDTEQAALWAQGREPLSVVNNLRSKAGFPVILPSENAYVVTMCDGVTIRSPHQDRRAADIVPMTLALQPCWPDKSDPRWLQIAEVMESFGITWGGRWKDFPDFPHYEVQEA